MYYTFLRRFDVMASNHFLYSTNNSNHGHDQMLAVHPSWSIVSTMQPTASSTEVIVCHSWNHSTTYWNFLIHLKYSMKSGSSTVLTPFPVCPTWPIDIVSSNALFPLTPLLKNAEQESPNAKGSLSHTFYQSHVPDTNFQILYFKRIPLSTPIVTHLIRINTATISSCCFCFWMSIVEFITEPFQRNMFPIFILFPFLPSDPFVIYHVQHPFPRRKQLQSLSFLRKYAAITS